VNKVQANLSAAFIQNSALSKMELTKELTKGQFFYLEKTNIRFE
jgi:hypothetical protein